jgi:hypothetical protein
MALLGYLLKPYKEIEGLSLYKGIYNTFIKEQIYF